MEDHPSIEVGREYPVLEVVTSGDRVLLRIPNKDGPLPDGSHFVSDGMWHASMFTVVSGRMPSCWVANLVEGRLTFAPSEWQRPGFWDEYFDDVPDAVADYRRLRAEILQGVQVERRVQESARSGSLVKTGPSSASGPPRA
ncbi:hypothetical protein ACWEO4_37765 [Streptomyces sp. NPDC004393]|uniref:hypothetical protein n=1 Tax=Streptomyces sp. NPDC004533 TaxID=3154278 RepID=UPI0033BBB419